MFLHISDDMTLSELNELAGSQNVPDILNVNGLKRSRNIGEQYREKCDKIIEESPEVSWTRKSEVLNLFSQNTDVFEYAVIQTTDEWKVLSHTLSFCDTLAIPDTVTLTRYDDVLGDGVPVNKILYRRAMDSLSETGEIAPDLFNDFSTIKNTTYFTTGSSTPGSNVFQLFNVPWGDVVFYSKLSGEGKDIPAYPEQMKDGRAANYDQMDSVLYQYEPWLIYRDSDGRTMSFDFHLHRQMWTGDERDGKANELIRFMEASAYPRYAGSTVNTDTVTLYIKGSPLITGVLTSCQVEWTGPIGLDGFYLEFTVSITISECSTRALNYDVVKSLPLIG